MEHYIQVRTIAMTLLSSLAKSCQEPILVNTQVNHT